jgi:DNA-binding response OmpR family regulator
MTSAPPTAGERDDPTRRRRCGRRAAAVLASPLLHTLAMPASILILADRTDIATFIARCLAGTGHRPLVAGDVRQAALILQRETPDVVVLDLAVPGHCDAAMQWLKRDPARAAIAIVRVSTLVRNGGAPRGEIRADVCVPKPFTPRQIVDGVRTALARRGARQRFTAPVAPAAVLRPAVSPPPAPPLA